ncbi:hypothetical protein IIM_02667 [Bacillus cereus VD107]|nr:hypothetical protein IIM_02667 [Bacillus cereus VD107]
MFCRGMNGFISKKAVWDKRKQGIYKNHYTKPLITLGGYGKMRLCLTNNE